jgi:hypothetical protein
MGANMPGAGAGIAADPGWSIATRRSMSALAAGSIDGPQADDVTATAPATATTNNDVWERIRAMVPNRDGRIKA